MSDLETKKNEASVEGFLQSVENDKRREDSFMVLDLMKEVTERRPRCGEPASLDSGATITRAQAAAKEIG